jgi:hypothetical protein
MIPSKGKIFLFSTASKLALGPTQLPIQMVLGALTPGVKWLGCEADQSPPSSAEVKNDKAIPPLPNPSSWLNAKLFKHRNKFTFTLFSNPQS